ncbi:BTAD domain-containing putative transcriptional regulator [Nocardia cyriacigeorgica]|uniref:BTAD domain-containing putative transcriptional regulator n=1 Tax=Nocardia cyriacigeorgica TaxID=135487 RepID=UPI001895364C|nr:BTAD domain-containing putative transcriptional regulator [Nocardia cyriacigeorgica]MBF6416314.1 winged helix-turn-helix domain-containing protein [Nocardia cyriacigeorgica]
MRFGVLGPLTVWTADGEVVPVPEKKVRALLAGLLTAPGRVVSADRLMEGIWGDSLPTRPAAALQTLVSRLRRAVGADLVAHRAPGYVLLVSADAVDAGEFASLAEQARRIGEPGRRAQLFAQALEQWRGPAFADFADDPFVQASITRLEEQRMLVLEEHAEARLQLGDYGRLATELQELTEVHPFRERLRATQMRALYGAGRVDEALAVYQDVRRHLDDELGLEPGRALVELHQEMLRRDLPIEPPMPDGSGQDSPRRRTNLPAPVTELIGRSGCVAEVRGLLSRERLVTLTGPGGVGKTRLALAAARESDDTYADGVWLVEFGASRIAGTAQEVVDGLAGAVAAVLEIRDDARLPPSAHSPVRQLIDALRGRELLLVFDNCEHVIDAAAALAQQVLHGAPRVRVLATSREPLDIAGEQLWQVPPLELPEPGATPAEILKTSAVRLFAARAAAAAPGFTLTEADADVVAVICRRMDGLPLALELASTRIRALGLVRLAERLDDRFGLLTSSRRDAPARQQTLRAMIDWSWELLTAAEQAVLSRLGVHVGGCSLEAAEILCAGGGVESGQVLDLLARLVDRSLVVVEEAEGPRYRLLESVAAYCVEQLRSRELEYAHLRNAHARYYIELAERADAELRGPEQIRWLRVLDLESANMRAALTNAAADGDALSARRLVQALIWYWFLRGRLMEARRSITAALAVGRPTAVAGSADPRLVAWRAALTLLCGDRAGASWDNRTPLRLYQAIPGRRDRSGPGWFLGYATTMFGDMGIGVELIDRALEDCRELGERWGFAAALTVRAVQRQVRGELDDARRYGEESLALFAEIGDQWGRLQANGVLGRLAEIRGDYRDAEARHREGLRIAEELALWTDAAARWAELGRIALLEQQYALADEFHDRARQLALAHGDRPTQESAEVGLALSARRQGELDTAERYLRPWLEWNRGFDAANGIALILAELGFVAEQRGDTAAALALHREGLAAARKTGDPRAVALAQEGLAGAQRLAGRPELAARLLGTAARAREMVGAPLPPAERGDVDRIATLVRSALGADRFEAEYARDG